MEVINANIIIEFKEHTLRIDCFDYTKGTPPDMFSNGESPMVVVLNASILQVKYSEDQFSYVKEYVPIPEAALDLILSMSEELTDLIFDTILEKVKENHE